MSESEQEQNSSPRFSKAIFGRILAVGFFVVLGTFAVIQSMRGTAVNAINATVSLDSSQETDQDNPLGKLAKNAAEKVESGISKTASNISTALTGDKSDNSNSSGFEPKAFTPPTGNLNRSTPTPNSFAGNSFGTPPTSQSFKPVNPTTPPNRSTPTSNVPIVKSDPAGAPPVRYAQAPGGKPLIGNNNGFGARPQSPTTFGDNPIAGKLDAATQKTLDSASQIKTNVADGARDLLRKAQEKVNEKADTAAGAFNQNSGGGFGARAPKIIGNFTPPPAKQESSDFGPPIKQPNVQPNFGARPTATIDSSRTFAPTTPEKQENNGFGGKANLQPIRPIATQIANDPIKTEPAISKSPFEEMDPPTNRSGFPATPRSIVSSQPNSPDPPTNQPNNQNGYSSPFGGSSPGVSSRIENKSGLANSGRFENNSRLGSGNSIMTSNGMSSNGSSASPSSASLSSASLSSNTSSSLTKDVPGDRQLDGIQAPALTVEKLSPREIQVNQTADFEIVVKNVGRATADDVRVFDEVPAGTEFLGANPEPTRIAQNRNIEWNIGQLRPGQEKRIRLQLKPIQPGEIGSVAQVTFATQASMRTLVTKPVLDIVHEAKPTYLLGDDVVLDVVVTNKGDGPAKNVMIQQDVPKQLDFPDGLPGGSRGIEYEIGTLMPGKSRRIQLALKAADIGKIQNVMYASAEGGLRAQHELPMEVVAPKLVASSDGATRRFLKREVSHQFSVANQGTASATNVELIARLPSGLRYIESNNQGRYDANTHAVYWSLAELDRGVEAKVELKTMPVEVGDQPIKFESSADLKARSNVEQALSVEHLVDVHFEIDDMVDPIEIGSDTSYRVRVVNQGTKAATNIQLQVDFPNGLQPTSVDGSLRHQIRGQQIVFEPISSMSPEDEVSIIIHGKGQTAGDHLVTVNMQIEGRSTPVSKQESTRVYSDR